MLEKYIYKEKEFSNIQFLFFLRMRTWCKYLCLCWCDILSVLLTTTTQSAAGLQLVLAVLHSHSLVLLSLALEAANLWLQWILTVCRQYQVVALRMWRQCWQCSPVQSFSLGYHMMPVFGWWKLPWKQFLINVGKNFFLLRIFSKHSCRAPIPFLMVISFENKLPVLVKLKYKTFIPCIYHQIFFHVLQCKNHSVSKYSLHCEKARRTYLRQ